MFADPSSLLVLQEISMDFLCDVSNEIKAENDSLTVFDFNIVMEGTEKRVNALLNYGPGESAIALVNSTFFLYQFLTSKYISTQKLYTTCAKCTQQ